VKSRRSFAAIASLLCASACARASDEAATRLARVRLVSAPSSIAYLSSERAASGLSGEIRFGGPLGRSALFLKFPGDWRAHGVPRRAFLTLSAREGSASSATPVTLEVWRLASDWQPRTLQHWSDKPSLAPPYARIQITASPAQDTRIDISEIVHFAAENPEREFGLAVIANGSDGPAKSFSSGLAGGQAPRLELYLR